MFHFARCAELYSDEFVARLAAERVGGALLGDGGDMPSASGDPFDFLAEAFERGGRRDAVSAASLADMTTYLPCDLLTKVDMASMAYGLECRQPFLDHRLVELVASLPLRMKLRGGQTKWILKRAFAELLPRPIARRPKQGFAAPVARWFRGSLAARARETLLDGRSLERGYFRPAAIDRLLSEHASGAWDHGHRLWALLLAGTLAPPLARYLSRPRRKRCPGARNRLGIIRPSHYNCLARRGKMRARAGEPRFARMGKYPWKIASPISGNSALDRDWSKRASVDYLRAYPTTSVSTHPTLSHTRNGRVAE